MSFLYPRDPLIVELKTYTSKLLDVYNTGMPVTDSHPLVLGLEDCLENIFYCSIKAQTSLFGYLWDGSAWRWMEKTEKSDDFYHENYQFTQVIESVKERKNLFTQDGRFRLAVRYCLVRKCLHRPIEFLRDSKKCEKYYVSDAILADDILTEILLSVIYQLNIVNFKLDLENSALLDLSWELPQIIDLDLVPSKSLGLSVKFAAERAIIIKITPNSVAQECPDIEIGDIIEYINNVQITSTMHCSLNSLLKTHRIKPTSLRIIKARTDCKILPAMLQLYKDIDLDPETTRNSQSGNSCIEYPIKKRQHSLKSKTGFTVTYLGCAGVGRNNEVKAIDKTFGTFFWPTGARRDKSMKQEVLFEVGELGVKFSSSSNNRFLEKHLFMQISACSRVTLMPNYFAYIAEKGNTKLPQNFKCYFFVAPSTELALVILQLMGQGFRSTNYAV